MHYLNICKWMCFCIIYSVIFYTCDFFTLLVAFYSLSIIQTEFHFSIISFSLTFSLAVNGTKLFPVEKRDMLFWYKTAKEGKCCI